MKNDGFMAYISLKSNVADLLMLTVFLLYFILRLINGKDGSNIIVPKHEMVDEAVMTNTWFSLVIFNVLIVFQMVVKICFFMKVDDKFGMLVQLIKTSINDVKAFALFMFIWLMAFSLISMLLGSNDDVGETYVDIHEFVGYFLLIFENSIGNINPPSYGFWLEKMKVDSGVNSSLQGGSRLVIYIIWIVWWLNQLLILIVLLNFLIAVIS